MDATPSGCSRSPTKLTRGTGLLRHSYWTPPKHEGLQVSADSRPARTARVRTAGLRDRAVGCGEAEQDGHGAWSACCCHSVGRARPRSGKDRNDAPSSLRECQTSQTHCPLTPSANAHDRPCAARFPLISTSITRRQRPSTFGALVSVRRFRKDYRAQSPNPAVALLPALPPSSLGSALWPRTDVLRVNLITVSRREAA